MARMNVKLANRVIIVTGANNGIGLHMVASLLKHQYKVATFDLSGENLASLRDTEPNKLIFRRCDVTSDADVKESVQFVVDKWGRIDVLVNNACLCIFKVFEQKDLEQTRQEFEVNYFGYVRMIAAVLPYMKSQGGGIIHNVSSGVGITGFPGIYGYASTKGAIESLTRALSLELAPYNIVINIMHPPLTNTKSASPLGIHLQVMANPADVGQKLAKKILSTKTVVTPDFRTAVFLFFSYRYPNAIGRLLNRLTERAKAKQ